MYAKLRNSPKKETQNILWDFEVQTDNLISARWPDPVIVNKKKKRIYLMADFPVPADLRVKLKENEKRDYPERSTQTLLENWKNYRTWKWRWYQL